MRHTAVLVLGLLLMLSGPLLAEEPPVTRLSLSQAVEMALGINANLKRAEESRLTSLSRLRIAGIQTTYGLGVLSGFDRTPEDTNLYNRLSGNLSYSSPSGTKAELELVPYASGSHRSSLGFSLRHPLMQGKGALSEKGSLLLNYQSEVAIQSKEYFLTRQAAVQNVIEAYFRAVAARERVKVQERALSIAREAAEGARKRAAEGLIPEINVSRAEIRVAETQEQLNQQQQNAREALDRLMLAIGRGVGQTPELTDPVPESVPELPSLVDAIKTALANHPELAISDENLAIQARKLALAEDRLRPRLDAVAGYNYSRQTPGMISGSLFSLGSLRAGFELQFPIDKRIDLEERQIAQRSLEVLRQIREFQTEQVAEQVRNAYRSAEAARASVEILTQNLKIAEDSLRIAQRMLEEGLSDNRDVLDAQDALTRAENGVLTAKIDLYLAHVNLKYAMGEDLTNLVVPK